MILVLVWPCEDSDPRVVGPFPTTQWAERYIERIAKRYHRLETVMTMAPILAGLVDGLLDIVFDPDKAIDIQSEDPK